MKELNGNEQKVLEVLNENTDTWGERCIGFDWIMADTKLSRKEVQKACKVLREKEFVEFYRGLMNDEGQVAGSGYCITRKGKAAITPCDVCGDAAEYDWQEDESGKMTFFRSNAVKRIRLCDVHYEENKSKK